MSFTVAILAQSSIRHGFFSNFWRAFPQKKGCRRQRVREVPPCQHVPWKSKPWVVVCWHLKWYQPMQCFWTKRKIAMKTANISISKYNSWQRTLCYQMMIRHWSLWDFMVNRMSWWFIQEGSHAVLGQWNAALCHQIGEDGLDPYQRVMMKAFMKYIEERMLRGVLENDATAEALEQLL